MHHTMADQILFTDKSFLADLTFMRQVAHVSHNVLAEMGPPWKILATHITLMWLVAFMTLYVFAQVALCGEHTGTEVTWERLDMRCMRGPMLD